MNVLMTYGLNRVNIHFVSSKFTSIFSTKFEPHRNSSYTNSYLPRAPIIGNKYYQPFVDKVVVKRWKRHWLLTMKHKANLEGPSAAIARCNEPNWNLDAELTAFNKRLQLDIPHSLLCAAFTEPLPVDQENDDEISVISNESLVEFGKEIVESFLNKYIAKYFPDIPNECSEAIVQYLTSDQFTANLASHLGIVDFIQSIEFPFVEVTKSRCFFSAISSIYCGNNGPVEAAKFIQDFAISDLIDKDILVDIWKPENPMKLFAEECKERQLGEPEVRLTKQSGINSALPVYFVGLYVDKQFYAESGGETLALAETDVANVALKKLYKMSIEDIVLALNLENEELAELMPIFNTNEIYQEYFTLNKEETNDEKEMQNQF